MYISEITQGAPTKRIKARNVFFCISSDKFFVAICLENHLPIKKLLNFLVNLYTIHYILVIQCNFLDNLLHCVQYFFHI